MTYGKSSTSFIIKMQIRQYFAPVNRQKSKFDNLGFQMCGETTLYLYVNITNVESSDQVIPLLRAYLPIYTYTCAKLDR